MPRRRRSRSRARPVAPLVTALVVVAVVVGLAVGSVAAISARSGPYRVLVGRGYVALAAPVVDASNATGKALAVLFSAIPAPTTNRASLEQGLDAATADSANEASSAARIAPPGPAGALPRRLAAVFAERAAAVVGIRATVDGLLGMDPLPVAGAPVGPVPALPTTILPTGTAAAQLAAEGASLVRADAAYASVARALRAAPGGASLPASAWIPPGAGATAPLAPSALGATADALVAAPGLGPVHRTIVSALGLSPPAAGGGSGAMGQGCRGTTPPPPPPTPAVLPPTTDVVVSATVTNCGNVVETGVEVTASLAPAAGGTPAVTATARVGLVAPGGSVAATLPALTSVHGRTYTLTVAVTTSAATTPAGVVGATWTVPVVVAS